MGSNIRLEGALQRGKAFQITVDGKPVTVYAGETVATALIASGKKILRRTAKQNQPRSVFCGIGVCYDCLVTVNGFPNQRACMTIVKPGLVVTRQLRIQVMAVNES